ncbi:hypothetical protein OS493_004153 [Desmophyllum pertusum]|uniref:Uncharacterized protein n=1 Tax=Desmophyllum pertusum TaxID=174260 RepID=A0A9W9ZSS9_9CNID|nr:hypothetical protein OS493_004153 [Desmophyllum pertusum]
MMYNSWTIRTTEWKPREGKMIGSPNEDRKREKVQWPLTGKHHIRLLSCFINCIIQKDYRDFGA